MKKLLYISQGFLFLAFNFTLLLTVYQFSISNDRGQLVNRNAPQYNRIEEYDPSLQHLNSIKKLILYCDSLYALKTSSQHTGPIGKTYTDIASAVMRKRFYHGYSTYALNNNFVAMLLSQVSLKGLNAIVIPDDILKYPYAACSQQSIVLMELLKEKGLTTRKVGFKGNISGHFCFEVFYEGSWHFYDTDMEPNIAELNKYNRPSVEFLANHKDVLLKAYGQYPRTFILDVFSNYSYGKENVFPAPNAFIFQRMAWALTYSVWLFFLGAFILVRKRYKKLALRKVTSKGVVSQSEPIGKMPLSLSSI